ncbi:prolipoprotein diacylglyceryl transferase [Thalassospiraceae bacterium LMO-JJ14]|nr:prolipoprotein diacylglyceryl transferase [Thalassospiraceae bacterium LMO-JJ14]
MFFAIPFPNIDPVIFQLGVFAIRWYSLAYIAGLVLGWFYMKRLCRLSPEVCKTEAVDDFLVWATMGVILGGRLGMVLFYQFDYYMANPAKIIAVWEGGMSFHGGFLGVVAAGILFTRKHKINPLRFGDLLGCVAPIGLFFGRIANFINGELWGRPADVAWAVVFPTGGPVPRHPSQLYEAAFEGLLLFAVMFALSRSESVRRRPGLLMGTFIAGYGIARSVGELFREPDAYIGFLSFGTTWGQWLSVPMIGVGVYFIIRARRREPV